MRMGRLASPLCVRWLRGRCVFQARTFRLPLAESPGLMVGRLRSRSARFGFAWLGAWCKDGSAPDARGMPARWPSRPDRAGIEMISEGEVFAGDRETVRRASVKRALELVLRLT